MKTANKTLTIIVIILLAILVGRYISTKNQIVTVPNQTATTTEPVASTTPSDKMSLTVFLQNKTVAASSDCRVTYPVVYQVNKTSAVADASLRILFEKELAQFGSYKSVSIENGVAKVVLANDIVSLSSCQSGHLLSVLNDTLTQYPTIKSVELYSSGKKIVF